MRRDIVTKTAARASVRACAAVAWAALALAATGCAVNSLGLEPDSGIDVQAPPVDLPVDRPVEMAPPDDAGDDLGGGDLVCGTCDPAGAFITLPGGRATGTTSGASATQGSCGGADAPEAVFTKMNEEHGFVDTRAAKREFAVGDRVQVIPNHVCVAVNLHEQVYGVRQGTVEQVWKVEGRGKLQ